jgi:hypothetical protein
MADKYFYNNAGTLTEKTAIAVSTGDANAGQIPALNTNGILDSTIINSTVTSAGAPSSGKVIALDSTGRLDVSVFPVGMGAEVQLIVASEALTAGSFVNIWSNSGVANVRKADASTTGKIADGFVLSAVTSGAIATVFAPSQTNTQLVGLTPGAQYWLSDTTPGGVTLVPPTGSGKTVQPLGKAASATQMTFAPATEFVLA